MYECIYFIWTHTNQLAYLSVRQESSVVNGLCDLHSKIAVSALNRIMTIANVLCMLILKITDHRVNSDKIIGILVFYLFVSIR